MLVRAGSSSSMHAFKSHVGIGSSSQDLQGDSWMIFLISSGVVGASLSRDLSNFGISLQFSTGFGSEEMSVLIFSILLMKNSLKSCVSYEDESFFGSFASESVPRRFFVILNRLLKSFWQDSTFSV